MGIYASPETGKANLPGGPYTVLPQRAMSLPLAIVQGQRPKIY